MLRIKCILLIIMVLSLNSCMKDPIGRTNPLDPLNTDAPAQVSIIAGKVTVVGIPSESFTIRASTDLNNENITYWEENYINTSGNYSIDISIRGTVQVRVRLWNGAEMIINNISINIGTITELNFEF